MKKKISFAVSVAFLVITFYGGAAVRAADNVGYDKGLYFKTDDDEFKLKFNIQLQPQFQYLSIEGAPSKTSTFQMRRARFVLSGNAFGKPLTYRFQFEAASGRISTTRESAARDANFVVIGAHTGPNLREAYINYKFNDHFELRAGQFKPFYNREELTSSTALQFVDRTINNEVFTHGYDLGAMLHGGFADKKWEYGVYVTNEGNNRNNFNFNDDLLMGARIMWNALGQHGYTQSDVNESEEHQLSVGLAASYNKPIGAAEDTILNVSGDAAWRRAGFSLVGEGNYTTDTTADASAIGFMGQAGYFFVPEKFEVAARGAAVMPDTAGSANGYEIGGSLNYFIKGHNLKWQTDYNMLLNSALAYDGASNARNVAMVGGVPGFADGQTDHRIRTQLQLSF